MSLVSLNIWNIKIKLDDFRGNLRTVLKDEILRRVISPKAAERLQNAACDIDDDKLVQYVGSRYIQCSSEGLKQILEKSHHLGWLKEFWIGVEDDQTYSIEFGYEGD